MRGGYLHRYRITASIDNVSVDIELVGQVPPRRPKSGHVYFAKAKGSAGKVVRLVATQGRATIDYRVGPATMKGKGIGYHDHNWGDAPMAKLTHDWY